MGDHSGQVEPSARSAYTDAGIRRRRHRLVDHLLGHGRLLSVLSVSRECTIWYMGATSGGDEPSRVGRTASAMAAAARQRLLDAVVAHFTADGLADQSLRRIAEAIGTSHRMLLYHFGSKDGLLLEVVREVEARTQDRLAALGEDAGGETDELIRRMWAYVADPALGDFERLFFALYGRALQGDESIRPLLTDDIAHWLDANVALSAPLGVPPTVAGPTPGSGWRSSAACCSTCSPPATAPARTPPSRSSRGATAAGGGSVRRRRAPATAPRRGRGGPGTR